jgi:AcrR family transcriptional regulator
MPDEQLLAPPRGRYDRRSTPEERLRAQRERLLRAVARAFVEGDPSVSRVAALARVGRGSFYEFFDDFEHALRTVKTNTSSSIEKALLSALASAGEPHAALRAVVSEYVDAVRRAPEATLAALAIAEGAVLSQLGDGVARVLRRWLASVGRVDPTITPESDSRRVTFAAAAAEVCARQLAVGELSRTPPQPVDGRALADALLRLLR